MSTSGGNPGGIAVAHAHLTGADLPTLFSNPVTVVAAPPNGKAILVVDTFQQWKPGFDRYTEQQTALILYDGDNPGGPNGAYFAPKPSEVAGTGLATAGPLLRVGPNVGHALPTATVNGAAIVAASDADPGITGPIVNFSIAAGGAGYVAGDTGTIDVGSGVPAAYHVSTVAPITGAVTLFAITQGDPVYDTANNPHTTTRGGAQPGIGVGFTVNVDSIPPPDGDLYLTVFYAVIQLH